MTHPIPDAALDDRLGFVGTAGSGKTYGAGAALERVLSKGNRCIVIDPLGVWYGLRLLSDGTTPSPFEVVIFGGRHGDLTINEHAGAIIGETVAGMKESAILDLSQLGTKAAERRFMLAFLTALYRAQRARPNPLHLVFDEADMWAPQVIRDRDQDPAKLLGMMETIVRRGRVAGFIPWLITQRPAVVNKDVLSQVDGLIAFKLTASQDRKALGDWIEGQADREQGKAILASLPAMDRGRAVVWVPGRGVLSTEQFPVKATFDSSRTPARGEKVKAALLKALDLGALKDRLATVEAEAKANDPRVLKAEIARLTRELKAAQNIPKNIPDPAALAEAEERGYQRGHEDGADKTLRAVAALASDLADALARAESAAGDARRLLSSFSGFTVAMADDVASRHRPTVARSAPQPKPKPASIPQPTGDLTGPQMKVIEALAFWSGLGFDRPTRIQVGVVAGYSPTSGGFGNLLGQLRTAGHIDYPASGLVSLTDTGRASAPEAGGTSVVDRAMSILSGPQQRVLRAVLDARGDITREALGDATGYSPTSGGFGNLLGSLRTLGLIDYPAKGLVTAAEWLS
ncbi:MAG: ATP-binding protein [Bauldia sp.]|nr:ATP-binding protein [Bauldia sp.]